MRRSIPSYDTDEWKVVPCTSCLYCTNEEGQVYSVELGRVIKPVLWGRYYGVNVRIDGIKQFMRVHRMVAATFLEICPDDCEVNHKNGNKLDNRLCNLEYCQHLYNVRHANAMGLVPVQDHKGEKNPFSVLTNSKVRDIIRKYSTGNFTQMELAEEFGVSQRTISLVVNRKSWGHVELQMNINH